jgi:hypothetical protein
LTIWKVRRDYEGISEPVVSMGRVVEIINDAGEKVPLLIQKYSDTLMIALLKAHRASKFNPPPLSGGRIDRRAPCRVAA